MALVGTAGAGDDSREQNGKNPAFIESKTRFSEFDVKLEVWKYRLQLPKSESMLLPTRRYAVECRTPNGGVSV